MDESGVNDARGDVARERDALELARREARLTLDAQRATMDDVDAKALSVFRLNVALAGVVVSALTFATSSDATDAAAIH